MGYNQDMNYVKNNIKSKSMETAITLINSSYRTEAAKSRLAKDIQEHGLAQVAHMNNFNLQALGTVYNGYMLEKKNKKEKTVKKTTTAYSNFIVPEQLVVSIEEYRGKFYLISGQMQKKFRGERFETREEALEFIYAEAKEHLATIKGYVGNRHHLKMKLSNIDYEFVCKWEYYFNHFDEIKNINKLNVSMDQYLYLQELLTGNCELDRHKKHKGRAVDFRKLNDVKYTLSETREDIDILCQLVQNYGIQESGKQRKKKKK